MNLLFDISIAVFVIIFSLVFLGLAAAMLEDTKTFKAIDEKIAKWLRRDREENARMKGADDE